MNSVMKVLLERRSTRAFDLSKPIKEGEMFEILKAAAYAPSAMNAQAWHFTVVMNKDKLLELNDAVKNLMGKSDIERVASRCKDSNYNFYYNAPVLVIVSCSDKALFPREDSACALENMFISATSLDIGSCWINQLGNDYDSDIKVREILTEVGVPKENKVYGAGAFGYIAKTSPLKDRAKGAVNFYN